VKANIGHLEGASGLASIVKSILTLEKGVIPPNALFETMNPAIDADALHVQVCIRLSWSLILNSFVNRVGSYPVPFHCVSLLCLWLVYACFALPTGDRGSMVLLQTSLSLLAWLNHVTLVPPFHIGILLANQPTSSTFFNSSHPSFHLPFPHGSK